MPPRVFGSISHTKIGFRSPQPTTMSPLLKRPPRLQASIPTLLVALFTTANMMDQGDTQLPMVLSDFDIVWPQTEQGLVSCQCHRESLLQSLAGWMETWSTGEWGKKSGIDSGLQTRKRGSQIQPSHQG